MNHSTSRMISGFFLNAILSVRQCWVDYFATITLGPQNSVTWFSWKTVPWHKRRVNFNLVSPRAMRKRVRSHSFEIDPTAKLVIEKYHYTRYDAGRTCWNALVRAWALISLEMWRNKIECELECYPESTKWTSCHLLLKSMQRYDAGRTCWDRAWALSSLEMWKNKIECELECYRETTK